MAKLQAPEATEHFPTFKPLDVLVTINLNSFRYRFRKLTWQEEFHIPYTNPEEYRKAFLPQALVDVSGLVISPENARRIFDQLPSPVLVNIFMQYKANLPEDQYFFTKALYDAPDQQIHQHRIQADDQAVDALTDKTLNKSFAKTLENEELELESQIIKQAKKEGKLVRASE